MLGLLTWQPAEKYRITVFTFQSERFCFGQKDQQVFFLFAGFNTYLFLPQEDPLT